MRHLQRIDEFLSTPYEWDWETVNAGSWVATFKTEDDKFWVEFSKEGPFEPWELKFSSDRREFNKSDAKGPLGAMRILTTVFLEIMVSFFESNPDAEVKFYGAQGAHDKTVKTDAYSFVPSDNNRDDTKRDRVYRMLMSQLPDNLKWEQRGRSIYVSRRIHMNESAAFRKGFDLGHYFDLLNKELFGGELEKVPLVWKTMRGAGGHLRSSRTVSRVNGRKVTGPEIPEYIAISDFYEKGEQGIMDTLAHEMIHLWIMQRKLDDDSYHGMIFQDKMKEINAKGIVNVTLKDDVSEVGLTNQAPLAKPVTVIMHRDLTLKKNLMALITTKAFTDEALSKMLESYASTSKYGKRDFEIEVFESTSPVLRKYPVSVKFRDASRLKFATEPEGVEPAGEKRVFEVKAGVVQELTK